MQALKFEFRSLDYQMNHLTAPEVTLAGILIVSATHHTRLHMEFSTVPIVLVQKKPKNKKKTPFRFQSLIYLLTYHLFLVLEINPGPFPYQSCALH